MVPTKRGASVFKVQIFETEKELDLAKRLKGKRRILVWGEMGAGKSTLAYALSRCLDRSYGGCRILSLEPGTPLFGVPGAICLGRWKGERFAWGDCQALCTLDAVRFRLPLAMAACRLMAVAEQKGGDFPVLIDPPGVAKGAGGAELLGALAETLGVDAVLALHREAKTPPLSQVLSSLNAAVIRILSSPEARRPSESERLARRTNLWDRFLGDSVEETFLADQMRLLGTPPPMDRPDAWAGRQAALLTAGGDTAGMGEVIELDAGKLKMRLSPGWAKGPPACLLIRDAERNAKGKLSTVPRAVGPDRRRMPDVMRPHALAPKAGEAPVACQVGPAWAVLAGGVLGDPLLHVRIRNLKQSFLFDLGDPARLHAKVAHQVRAVFLSHAHVDHIGGFLWLLRSRIGHSAPCQIFGPADTIDRIENFLGAVTWDRIGDDGPVFEVCEIGDGDLRRARLQPGKKRTALPCRTIGDGTILADEKYRVKAAVCDHGIPSVAYALVFAKQVAVIKEKLEATGWRPGPWLGHLKKAVASGKLETEILLPDGTNQTVEKLAERLVEVHQGKKLVYAADMADTPENREKMIALARCAHTLFCETAFSTADKERAEATQHLTARAAVEIARAARVERLVPFHFSKRYEKDPGRIYEEIRKEAGPVETLGEFSPYFSP